tara:strand:- start:1774 stop:2661 length:888 start_codon:yes stop_codon:yes gene_type:complete
MARCLVTGHKGFIGSELFSTLTKAGHEVLGADIKETPSRNVIEALKEHRGSSFHPRYWNFKPDYVFHLACNPRVGDSIENPVDTMKNNVIATSVVLNYARKVGAKRVIYSDSSAVVGNGDSPSNPYGLQKLVSEMECKLYSELYGLDCVSLRYFNVYSESQSADGPYATAIANWMEFIRQKKNPFITGTGTQKRDMIHLTDIVSANIFAMNSASDFGGKWYDVGTGKSISLNEIKYMVKKHFPNVKFDTKPPRPGEVEETVANTSPLRDLGWEHRVGFDDGINSCFSKLRKELTG